MSSRAVGEGAIPDEVLALYALGVPVAALAKQYGVKAATLRKKASNEKVRRPAPSDRALLQRIARTERIKRSIADTPSIPLFSDVEKAA